MSRAHVDHREVSRFAEEKVNLPKDRADEYRAQAGRVREKLEAYISDHPDFALKRIMLSGSLAKGTALRTLNDIDMAVYVSGSDAPHDLRGLLDYLAERLRKAFPNFSPDQVKPQTYSVTVSFRGSGLDVDVVPVLYAGLADWRGDLISQEDGSFLETSIPLHLEFARKRKKAQPNHYAQVVRLVKFWARLMKKEREDFRFKSFMIEMILAKLCDDGVDFSDYPEALQAFFTYLANTGSRFGQVNTLVNNAGIEGVNKPTDQLSLSEWERVMAVNTTAVFLCTKHAVPHLKRSGGGSVVNISSIYGIVGGGDIPPYHAAKGAVRTMTKNDALTYAADRIRFNSVHPGFIFTALVKRYVNDAGWDAAAAKASLDALHPLGGTGTPDDIAWGVVYLASDQARWVTGAELVIDGGYTPR